MDYTEQINMLFGRLYILSKSDRRITDLILGAEYHDNCFCTISVGKLKMRFEWFNIHDADDSTSHGAIYFNDVAWVTNREIETGEAVWLNSALFFNVMYNALTSMGILD